LGGMAPRQDSLPMSCSAVGYLRGPSRGLSPTYSGITLSGRVVISGARFGSSRSALIPAHDVPVALMDTQGRMIGVTLTDLNGAYTFRGLAANAVAMNQLALLQDAILRPALRTSGSFLRTNKYDIFGENQVTGVPHNLSNPIFQMLLDDQQQPLYNRLLTFNSFEGDAFPVNWWRFELQGYGELYDDLAQSQLNGWRTAAAALLPCTVNLYSSNTLESNLAAAALNHVSGRGIFAPYLEVQKWYIGFASHVFCNRVSNTADINLATRFVDAINTADDIAGVVSFSPF